VVLQISDHLAKDIQEEATVRGLSVETFLQSAILRERTLADRQKIEAEQDWWLKQPLKERAKYEGKYVAINNKQLVDQDKNDLALRQRIRAKYGKTPILIIAAEGPREVRILSPRLVK